MTRAAIIRLDIIVEHELTFGIYTSIAGMLATLVTLIVAGLIAVYQLVDKQYPKRSLNDFISKPVQIIFLVFAGIIFACSLAGAWALGTQHNLDPKNNWGINLIVSDPSIVGLLIVATFLIFLCFMALLFASRYLFDNRSFLISTAKKFRYYAFSQYLFAKYSTPPFRMPTIKFAYADLDDNDEAGGSNVEPDDPELAKKREENAQIRLKIQVDEYERKMKSAERIKDPVGPLVDFVIRYHNRSPDDVEMVAIPLIEQLLGSALTYPDRAHIGSYIEEFTQSAKIALEGSESGLKRRFVGLLEYLAKKAIEIDEYDTAVRISTSIHTFTRDDNNEFLRLTAIQALNSITSSYYERNETTDDGERFENYHEKLCLVVARMAENYYHSLEKLTPVAIVEDNHHETEDFSAVMANYFAMSKPLYERFPKLMPAIYFDSIDLSAEAFAGAMSRSNTVENDIGNSRYKYGRVLSTLYYIFFEYGEHWMKKKRFEYVGNSIFRLERGLKFVNDRGLEDQCQELASHLYHLGVMIAAYPKEIKFGVIERSKEQMLERISKNINEYVVDMNAFKASKSGMDHSLYGYEYEGDAQGFMNSIDWERDEIDESLIAPFVI